MFQMESKDGDGDIDCLERGLLSENGSCDDCEAEDEAVYYTASFEENEENFVKYQTAKWVLYSLLLILAWGIGLFMLIFFRSNDIFCAKTFGRGSSMSPLMLLYTK